MIDYPAAQRQRIEVGRILLGSLRKSIRENLLIIAVTVIYAAIPFYVSERYANGVLPYRNLPAMYLGFATTCAVSFLTAFALWFLYLKRIKKVPDVQAVVWRIVKNDFLTRDRIMLGLPILLLWPIFARVFSYMKALIPMIQPFYLDQLLYEWDRWLHFGVDPWRLLQPILGYPPITFLINLNYTLWFLVIHVAVLLMAFYTKDRRLRLQFLFAMILAWPLLGNFAATLLSSAGPCFFGKVVTGVVDPYQPLMAYLHQVSENSLSFTIFGQEYRVSITALVMQDILWKGYVGQVMQFAHGISAAPSLHIGSTWLVARLCFALGRRFAIAGGTFLVLMLIGSIHLGWHYALDGYIAILCAWILWRFCGWLLSLGPIERWLWNGKAAPVVASAN